VLEVDTGRIVQRMFFPKAGAARGRGQRENFLEAQLRLGPVFHHGLHHSLHDKKLGETACEVECDECVG
jgi:hypothetical protein